MFEELVCAENKGCRHKTGAAEAQNGCGLWCIYAAMDAEGKRSRQIDDRRKEVHRGGMWNRCEKELGEACGIKVPMACAMALKEEEIEFPAGCGEFEIQLFFIDTLERKVRVCLPLTNW